MTDLPLHSARELSALLQSRKVSAVEVLDAHLARIDQFNPALNAIVTLDVEGARRQAAAIDARRAHGEALGPFAGLPIAIKDMEPVKGMRSTLGSTIYRDWVPDFDSLIVSRFREHGMVVIGKTNTPEFAMGSQTFNRVFGATRNPWNLERTCGGSSGGAAVSVAMHMLPFADGTDLGGSLRNPGNFNHVFGLRPSPGRVPTFPSKNHWIAMSVLGPIARTASDGAFLLAAMAGADRRVPLSIPEDPAKFLAPLDRDFRGVRVAYSRTLGGLPVDHGVTAAHRRRREASRGARLHRRGGGAAARARRRRRVRHPARAVARRALRRPARHASRRAQGHRDLEHRARLRAHRARGDGRQQGALALVRHACARSSSATTSSSRR